MKVNRDDAVVSIVFIDGVPNESFGRRCSRGNDTFKGNRVPVKKKWFDHSLHLY